MRSVRINSICLSFTSPPSLLVLKNDCRYFPNSQTQIKTIHDMVTYFSRDSLQLEKYSLSSRWLILFELRAKRQKVPIGSCWSNFLATQYHEPTNFAEQRLKCEKTTNDFAVIGVSFPSDLFEDGASFLDQSLRKDKQS